MMGKIFGDGRLQIDNNRTIWLFPLIAVLTILLIVAMVGLVSKYNLSKVIPFEGVYPDAVTVELVTEEGVPYTIETIDGQVCVWFDRNVSFRKAKKTIHNSGGEIVAQIPAIGYYLVKVSSTELNNFLSKIKRVQGVARAFPNIVSCPCVANTYILDNFYPISDNPTDSTPHGVVVQYALQEFDDVSHLKAYNIGTNNGKSMCISDKSNITCTNNAVFALNEIASATLDGPIIINMSFGPYLRQREGDDRYYWNSATDEEKLDYQQRYLESIQNIIRAVEPLAGKDFVVTKSAGNNGVKDFDASIVSFLQKHLKPNELEVLDKHFLIVTAGEKDKKSKVYSNEMEKGQFHPWVTKVDISDFQYDGRRKYGTSFAAPRVAGIISWAVNKYDLSATKVLQYARKATESAPDNVLTQELLKMAIEEDDSGSDITIEGVLKMFLLNDSGDGNTIYSIDSNGYVEYAIGNDDYPHGRVLKQYRETDGNHEFIAFVLVVDNPLDMRSCLTEEDLEFLEENIQSAFMLVPNFQYTGKDFAEKYANKRVRAKGVLYVPLGGWRNATDVVMDLTSITTF